MEKALVTSELNTHTLLNSSSVNASVGGSVTLSPWNVSATANDSSSDTDTAFTPGVQEEFPFDPWNNNPYELISVQAYEITLEVTHLYFGTIIFLIGVPTNILSALVFCKQGLRDRMNLCLLVLALVDGTFIASTFVASIPTFLMDVDVQLSTKYSAMILAYFVFFPFAMKSASGCISVVVAVERCVCVAFPLRANSIMRTRTMGALLAAIVILNTLAYTILCFRYKTVRVYDEATGLTYYKSDISDFFLQNPLLMNIFYDILISFVLPLVTFVVVGVATAITVIKLKTAMAWRASTSSGRADNHSQQQQAALTKMLVILSCVFMACSAPYTALNIVRLLVPDFNVGGRYEKFFWASHIVSGQFFAPINSSVNFFVYYARSARFRADLRDLFKCCYRSKQQDKKLEISQTVSSTLNSNASSSKPV